MVDILRFAVGWVLGIVGGAAVLWHDPSPPRPPSRSTAACPPLSRPTARSAPAANGCDARRAELTAAIAIREGQLHDVGVQLSDWPHDVDERLTEAGLWDWFQDRPAEGVSVTQMDCLEYPCILHMEVAESLWRETHIVPGVTYTDYLNDKGRREIGPIEAELGVERMTVRSLDTRGPITMWVAYVPPDTSLAVRHRARQRMELLRRSEEK